jgi:hypothetical protein
MLIDAFKHDCVMMVKASTPDGIGGFTHQWREGVSFRAAIVKDTSMEARAAEHQGVTELYTVTISDDLQIGYHDAFKRLADGAIFRVTSNPADSMPPKTASFRFAQVTAERWELS